MKNKLTISNLTVAYNGAMIGIAVVFAYSTVVMIYVIIRSSATIYSIMPPDERGRILFASGFAVAYSVAIFSISVAIFSSVIGFVVSIVLKNMLLYFNPSYNFTKALLVSCTIALSTVMLIYFLLHTLLKDWMTFTYMEPFLFWFLFPAILFSIVCVIGGLKLNVLLGMRLTTPDSIQTTGKKNRFVTES